MNAIETHHELLARLTAPAKKEFGTGDCYETPDALYNALHKRFNFKLDAFASKENTKCNAYYTEENSALTHNWELEGSIWMNPPYSRGLIYRCMEAAYEQSLLKPDRIIAALVRDDSTTKWYNNFIDGKASQVWRLKYRLKFKGAKNCSNFPCCVVIYNLKYNFIGNETFYKRWWYENA